MKPTQHRNIQPKPYKRQGQTYQPTTGEIFHADVTPNDSIRIFGTYTNHVDGPQNFLKVFRIGDFCVYDRFNLIYTGQIVAIGPKTVTVDRSGTGGRKGRMDLYDFCRRNWNYDAERIANHNAEESMCI